MDVAMAKKLNFGRHRPDKKLTFAITQTTLTAARVLCLQWSCLVYRNHVMDAAIAKQINVGRHKPDKKSTLAITKIALTAARVLFLKWSCLVYRNHALVAASAQQINVGRHRPHKKSTYIFPLDLYILFVSVYGFALTPRC